jgi:uncharacterized protein YkwD
MHLNVMRRATIMLILSILLAIGLGVSEASSAELPADAVSPDETVGAAATTQDDPASELILFNLLNQARLDQGLSPLQRDPLLDGIASDWTVAMGTAGRLEHRPDIVSQVESRVTTEWVRVAENIGWGPDAEWLHEGFWNSAPHRKNMLGDYNRVGIGAMREADGDVWVTVNFLKGPDLPVATLPSPIGGASPVDAWAVSPDGTVIAYAGAPHLGDPSNLALARPIVGLTATPSGNGYWLVASDGGIFSYGDARFHGSTGALQLKQPIVGMASTPSGNGYWLVASDGGIFSFGDARFHGSTGALQLNRPIVGMASTPSGNGYWLTASDGGIFSFGDAQFHGSTGAMSLPSPVTAMTASPTGRGYWLASEAGTIYSFGDATASGSATNSGSRVVGLTRGTNGIDYWVYLADGRALGFGRSATGSTPVVDPLGRLAGVSVRSERS